MKKTIFKLVIVLLSMSVPSAMAGAWDLNNVLGNIAKSVGKDSTTTASSSSGNGGGLLGSLLGSIFSKDKLTVKDISGDWKYTSPAVAFKSENLLMKAGGAAAATTVKEKLVPYYKTAGMESLQLSISPDSTFTMKTRYSSLKGTITQDVADGSEANFVFNFTVLGKVNIGKMEAYVALTGNKMGLMFDVTKLVSLMQKAAVLTGSSTAKGVSGILDNYDGICAGYELEAVKK